MADLSQTAANVRDDANAVTEKNFKAGEAFDAGMVVYRKASDGKWWKAQCDGTAEESGVGVQIGIAITTGVADQYVVVQTGGDINLGATVAIAAGPYVVSATAGGIAPMADLASTNRLTWVGYAISTSIVRLWLTATGLQKA